MWREGSNRGPTPIADFPVNGVFAEAGETIKNPDAVGKEIEARSMVGEIEGILDA